ncbi:hypothetical protein GCM10027075_60200 [Streptomyces heilongjiangensis]
MLSACRAHVLVRDVRGLVPGAARVRAGRRDGANVARRGTSRPLSSLGAVDGVGAARDQPAAWRYLRTARVRKMAMITIE